MSSALQSSYEEDMARPIEMIQRYIVLISRQRSPLLVIKQDQTNFLLVFSISALT